MMNINSYNDFLFESMDDDSFIPNKVYHNSPIKINSLGDSPMWFSLEREYGEEYYNNRLLDGGPSYLYEGIIKSGIPHIYSDYITRIFAENEIDQDEWISEIVGNPDSDEVMSLEGTKIIMNAGYPGIVYPDYDPFDYDNDVDTLIIFNPKKTVTAFILIKTND
jgi:hypothetical protein